MKKLLVLPILLAFTTFTGCEEDDPIIEDTPNCTESSCAKGDCVDDECELWRDRWVGTYAGHTDCDGVTPVNETIIATPEPNGEGLIIDGLEAEMTSDNAATIWSQDYYTTDNEQIQVYGQVYFSTSGAITVSMTLKRWNSNTLSHDYQDCDFFGDKQ